MNVTVKDPRIGKALAGHKGVLEMGGAAGENGGWL